MRDAADEAEPSGQGELVLYTTEDGSARFFLRTEDGTIWLTQMELAALFQTSVPNINIHIRNVLDEDELLPEATIKEDLMVRIEGKREVRRPLKLYSLDMILAVGYRVKSPRGTQFRQWATAHLKEYLVKGFVMDDARLKDPGSWDYFDEMLQRIRDIRASEKRFYQKVRDVFALSVDYKDDPEAVGLFFAEVQNKMFYAVTQHTAAEIVVQRADSGAPNMALTAWKAGRVRKADVIVAKNYLNADEIDHLNRIVTLFLDFAELRAERRKDLRMTDWRAYVDTFIEFNESPLLKGTGRMSHDEMVEIVHGRYEKFDIRRREMQSQDADAEDLRELERAERQLSQNKGERDAS
ncbi:MULTISPECIES: virulence RhuM family protein [unclassified Variovorax]|uniref:virulence RhuM family protein n=1 Tax=unclassified Variovorax TaxID=663243 RepID=UPI0008C41435|nr:MULTISPECIES: virulence RhuM family protein [unclassified Variovorax]SEJ95912.1 Uncharacterized conserved protein [Variovorax sp. OK202]SFD19986.1 Uncharacterized conserved protein [Variovorax sp. OK212]